MLNKMRSSLIILMSRQKILSREHLRMKKKSFINTHNLNNNIFSFRDIKLGL